MLKILELEVLWIFAPLGSTCPCKPITNVDRERLASLELDFLDLQDRLEELWRPVRHVIVRTADSEVDLST